MANKINDADHILITLRFSSLSKSNARELTITLGFQSTIERADSPVREIICPCCEKYKTLVLALFRCELLKKFNNYIELISLGSGHGNI